MFKRGYSQVELMIVISLVAILFSLGSVVYSSFVRQDLLLVESRKVKSLLNEAKVKTVSGYLLGGETALNFGVYFESDRYVLFAGDAYDPGEAKNQVFFLPEALNFSEINLVNQQVVFEKITGAVVDFNPDQNSLTLSDSRSSLAKVISLNQLGIVLIEEGE